MFVMMVLQVIEISCVLVRRSPHRPPVNSAPLRNSKYLFTSDKLRDPVLQNSLNSVNEVVVR